MKRAGFTMIELIFVIVILGILAAVAVPKLAATRDDAKYASEMTSVNQAIQNLGAEWTAQGAFNNYTIANANSAVECFTFADAVTNTSDGNVSLVLVAVAGTTECPAALRLAVATDASAAGLVDMNVSVPTYHVFGGMSIAR